MLAYLMLMMQKWINLWCGTREGIPPVSSLYGQSNHDFVNSDIDFIRCLSKFDTITNIGLDTETQGLDPHSDAMILLQLGYPGYGCVFDVRRITPSLLIEGLKTILESKKFLKIIHNANFEYKMLKAQFGIVLDRVFDTYLAEKVIMCGLSAKYGLSAVVKKYLDVELTKDVRESFIGMQSYQDPTEDQITYALNDVLLLPDLFNKQVDILRAEGLIPTAQLEFEAVFALADMELIGCRIDRKRWSELVTQFGVSREKAKAEILVHAAPVVDQHTLFGKPHVNINSQKQLLAICNKLDMDLENTSKTTLKEYGGDIVNAILKYREYQKAVSSFGENILNKIHPKIGRLLSHFDQIKETGRTSSYNPNFQNFPARHEEFSKVRECFVASPGNDIITADFSQCEIRILAELSEDPILISALNRGEDIHVLTASFVFNKLKNEVTLIERKKAKDLNFTIIYGASRFRVASMMDVSEVEGTHILDRFSSAYSGITQYLQKSALDAKTKGYSITVLGRKRYYFIPDKEDPEFFSKIGHIERQGKNTPIQGTNADILKQSLVNIRRALLSGGHNDVYLISQVHDEILLESPKHKSIEMKELLVKCMDDAFYKFIKSVKNSVNVTIADHWAKD